MAIWSRSPQMMKGQFCNCILKYMNLATKQTKTIWIFNHYAISPEQSGGTRHYDFAVELVRRGYEVVIFASSFSHRERRELKLSDGQNWTMENVDGVNFVWVRTFPYRSNGWRRFANMLSFKRRSKKVAKRLPSRTGLKAPDIVIGSSVHLFAVSAGASIADHFEARFFMEVRDIWPQTLVDMNAMSKKHPFVFYLGRLEKILYEKAEFIITPLPLAHEYFAGRGIPADRVLFLPQGVQISGGLPALVERRGCEPFTVMYAGSFGQADYLDMLIEAAQLLVDEPIRFVFMGDGEAKSDIVKWAAAHKLNNVEFRDPVPKHRVQSVLSEADACLAYFEDIGVRKKYGMALNKIMDYMAAARPIIFVGDVPNDMVAASGCGLSVRPGDPNLIANAIKKLASLDSATRKQMGERGWRYLAENHALPILVDRLEALWSGDDQPAPKRTRNLYFPIKRALDVTLATAGLIFTAPLILAIAGIIRLTMGSPVFFLQSRPGLNGKPFVIIKFRTMLDLRDEKDRELPDAGRLSTVGRFLRGASLDELPELVNVLKGEMSLVGPRPLLTAYLSRYTPTQARRHEVRPGITGWAQVNGRNTLAWKERFEHDVWYVDNCSLLLDLRILWMTLIKVLRREGVSADNHATMPEFEGSRADRMLPLEKNTENLRT